MSAISVKRTGILLCLVAPTAGGKTSLGERLLKENPDTLKLSVSVTTRAPRKEEREGVSYFFVDRAEFQRRIDQGAFFEHEEIHGELYGTQRKTVEEAIATGCDLLLDIDIKGAVTFKRAFPQHTATVFLAPPSFAVLKERLSSRGSLSEAELQRRFATARSEYQRLVEAAARGGEVDYFLINDRFESAYQQLAGILGSERIRLSRLDQREIKKICRVEI